MVLPENLNLSEVVNDLGLYGIHIYQDGKTIYQHRFRSDDRENLYSASKTFVAIAIGIAVDEGLLKLDDQVLTYFPEYELIASEGSELITVEHLLLMASGHKSEDFLSYNIMDRAELFFKTKIETIPGKSFYYEDLSSYMLGRVIEKISGVNLLNYLKPRLFDKLDIINPQWHTCQKGHTASSGGLFLKTEEFSRLGILLLNKGNYKGQQIVSPDYIKNMLSNHMATLNKYDEESRLGYGYHVFMCSPANSYRADGMYGQICAVFEDYGAVITYTGHNEESGKDALRLIYKEILPLL